MEYFVSLESETLEKMGDAVQKPITVIDGLKQDLASANQEISRLEDANAELTERLANSLSVGVTVPAVVTNSTGHEINVPYGQLVSSASGYSYYCHNENMADGDTTSTAITLGTAVITPSDSICRAKIFIEEEFTAINVTTPVDGVTITRESARIIDVAVDTEEYVVGTTIYFTLT